MKRFVIKVVLFFIPLATAMIVTELAVDWKSMGGDIGRMTRLEFHYTRPAEDTVTARGECIDILPHKLADSTCTGIAVFGDSFSDLIGYWPKGRWHQYAAGVLGTNVVFMITYRRPVAVYYSVLLHHPEWLPDTVIIESVERCFIERLYETSEGNMNYSLTNYKPQAPPNPNVWYRRIPNYWRIRILGEAPTESMSKKLDRKVFVCRPDTLFHYCDDEYARYGYSSMKETAFAQMRLIDSISEAKGKHLYWLVIPDKLTVYEKHLKEPLPLPSFLDDTVIERIITPLPLFRQMVDDGINDVYYCDDTHFSSLAAKETGLMVGKAILNGS